MIYYGGKPVEYGLNYEIDDLKNALAKENNVVIIQHKKFDDEIKALDFNVIDNGRKYVLIEGK